METIQKSDWMDEGTRNNTLTKASIMSKYIGYHINLRSAEVEHFYDNLPVLSEDNFLETGMALIIHTADRSYKRFTMKNSDDGLQQDWTK